MSEARRVLVVALVVLAVFLGALEFTIVVTALPVLGRTFPGALAWLPWVTSVSLMAGAVALLLGGMLTDRWGVKRTFLLGTTLFTVASLFSGSVGIWLPNRFWLLIVFRVLQGLGGGMLAPVGLKVVSLYYKGGRRTAAVGLAGSIAPLAAMLGPVLGGILADRFPWQAIFLVNVPPGVLVLVLGLVLMRETPGRKAEPVDVRGVLALSAAVVAVLLGFAWMRSQGVASLRVWAALLAAGLFGLYFLYLEKRHPTPLLDPALIADRKLSALIALSFVQGAAMYSTLYFLAAYAQMHPAIRAGAAATGVMLAPAALGQALTAPAAGFLLPRTGYRAMIAAGILVTTASLLAIALGPVSMVALSGLLLLGRVGGAMTAIPLAAAGLEARLARAGTLTGLRQFANVLGGVVGPVLLGLLWPAAVGPDAPGSFTLVFLVLGTVVLASLLLVRLVPDTEAGA